MLRESLELYQLHGHTRGVAWVLIHLAWLALDTGRSRAAARILERAHALCEEIGDRLGIARCLQLEGYLAWWHGNLEASRELHMRSADLSRELCDRWGTAWALHRLCVTLCALAERDGDVAPMPHLIHEALGLWRELGERRHFAFSLCDQAIDVGLRGEFEAALGSLDEAHSIFAALEDDFGICCVFMNHCVLLAARGEFGAAVRVTAALFSRSGGRMDRVPVPIRDRVANLLRDMEATHGPDLTRATWEMGRRMTMTEVIDFVQTVVSRTASQVAVV
jgi:hypothetical protein